MKRIVPFAALALLALGRAEVAAQTASGFVQRGATAQVATVEVTNSSPRDPIEPSVRVAGASRWIRNLRIEPDSAGPLPPGRTRRFKVRFDVAADAPAGALEALRFEVSAPGGELFDHPSPEINLHVLDVRLVLASVTLGGSGSSGQSPVTRLSDRIQGEWDLLPFVPGAVFSGRITKTAWLLGSTPRVPRVIRLGEDFRVAHCGTVTVLNQGGEPPRPADRLQHATSVSAGAGPRDNTARSYQQFSLPPRAGQETRLPQEAEIVFRYDAAASTPPERFVYRAEAIQAGADQDKSYFALREPLFGTRRITAPEGLAFTLGARVVAGPLGTEMAAQPPPARIFVALTESVNYGLATPDGTLTLHQNEWRAWNLEYRVPGPGEPQPPDEPSAAGGGACVAPSLGGVEVDTRGEPPAISGVGPNRPADQPGAQTNPIFQAAGRVETISSSPTPPAAPPASAVRSEPPASVIRPAGDGCEGPRKEATLALLRRARDVLNVSAPTIQDVQAASTLARNARETAPACLGPLVDGLTAAVSAAESAVASGRASSGSRRTIADAAAGLAATLTAIYDRSATQRGSSPTAPPPGLGGQPPPQAPARMAQVPNVINMDRGKVGPLMIQAGLRWSVAFIGRAPSPAHTGLVVRTEPPPGATVPVGSLVTLHCFDAFAGAATPPQPPPPVGGGASTSGAAPAVASSCPLGSVACPRIRPEYYESSGGCYSATPDGGLIAACSYVAFGGALSIYTLHLGVDTPGGACGATVAPRPAANASYAKAQLNSASRLVHVDVTAGASNIKEFMNAGVELLRQGEMKSRKACR